MGKKGKRFKKVRALVEEEKLYEFEEACELVCKTASAKFDETVDIALNLGVDPRKADQNVRGSVALPHGLGKEVRVAVFAKGEKAAEATAAGADVVGAEDLAEDSPIAQTARMWSAAFSPMMIEGAFTLPLGIDGITEASTTRRPSTPWTRHSGSTTASESVPILQVPQG